MGRSDTVGARRRATESGRRSEQRRAIVEAAARAIEEHGPEAAIGHVAERAGLPRPHVYRHFTGREDLDAEVARHAARQLSEWIRPALTGKGPLRAVIHESVRQTVAWAEAHPNLYRFRSRRRLGRAVSEVADAGFEYLRAAGLGVRPHEQSVASVVGLVDASVVWWLDHRDDQRENHGDDLDADRLADRVTRQVWLVLKDMLDELGV